MAEQGYTKKEGKKKDSSIKNNIQDISGLGMDSKQDLNAESVEEQLRLPSHMSDIKEPSNWVYLFTSGFTKFGLTIIVQMLLIGGRQSLFAQHPLER